MATAYAKTRFPIYRIGHFINQPHNLTECEVTRFGEMEEPDIEDPHKHTFYEILWVEAGSTTQVVDYQTYTLGPRALFFISPGQMHHFEEWQTLEGGTVMFTENFFLQNQPTKDKLFELGFLDNRYAQPSIEVNEAQFAEVLHTIALLTNEKKRADCSNEIVQSLLHILLLQIQRCVDGQTTVPVSKRYVAQFKQFRLLLERDFAQNRTAGDFAQDMFITQHHLNHICKAVTGRTATEVIRGRSILEAQRMLSFTDKPVGEIAAELGYFDSSYFAKMFRAEVGCSALEFRKKY